MLKQLIDKKYSDDYHVQTGLPKEIQLLIGYNDLLYFNNGSKPIYKFLTDPKNQTFPKISKFKKVPREFYNRGFTDLKKINTSFKSHIFELNKPYLEIGKNLTTGNFLRDGGSRDLTTISLLNFKKRKDQNVTCSIDINPIDDKYKTSETEIPIEKLKEKISDLVNNNGDNIILIDDTISYLKVKGNVLVNNCTFPDEKIVKTKAKNNYNQDKHHTTIHFNYIGYYDLLDYSKIKMEEKEKNKEDYITRKTIDNSHEEYHYYRTNNPTIITLFEDKFIFSVIDIITKFNKDNNQIISNYVKIYHYTIKKETLNFNPEIGTTSIVPDSNSNNSYQKIKWRKRRK